MDYIHKAMEIVAEEENKKDVMFSVGLFIGSGIISVVIRKRKTEENNEEEDDK